jgi:hypothetical protein
MGTQTDTETGTGRATATCMSEHNGVSKTFFFLIWNFLALQF